MATQVRKAKGHVTFFVPRALWCIRIKPRSYGLSFHEFRPRFALFPVVGTGRIDVARGLVSTPVVSRVMAVNSSHVKEAENGQTPSVHPFP
ncbi:hypothetical protein AVEN_124747-1 [Araneus ventricosus]|uniref:Uncharacterized protein n=1 Tax=Araneus ventricosus TaxID=182803 RepID=A0A4Y2J9Z6_ARAVE|nr:hypothetical protein AVEN_95927-1 [Araneus ventricosus]GBM86921.1 hypothetical protein AVEN_124747-1 [Araneus ventricosus]